MGDWLAREILKPSQLAAETPGQTTTIKLQTTVEHNTDTYFSNLHSYHKKPSQLVAETPGQLLLLSYYNRQHQKEVEHNTDTYFFKLAFIPQEMGGGEQNFSRGDHIFLRKYLVLGTTSGGRGAIFV